MNFEEICFSSRYALWMYRLALTLALTKTTFWRQTSCKYPVCKD